MNFYRVELDSSGKLILCTLVPCQGARSEGASVFVVEAAGTIEAIQLAKLAYRDSQRKALARRRSEYVADGKCRCGRDPNPGRKQCQVCLDSSAIATERAQKRASGCVVEIPPKSVAFAARKIEQERDVRLQVLREILDVYEDSKVDDFGVWLRKQIRALEKGKAAA
jgi:hypothetical protein